MVRFSDLKKNVLISIYYGLIVGVIAGMIRTVIFIKQNVYLPYNLQQVHVYLYQHSIYQLVSLITLALIVFAVVITLIKKIGEFVFPALVAGAIFLAGGYYLNKNVFPGFYELESMAGNGFLFLVCLGIGYFIYKFYRPKFKFIVRWYHPKLFLLLIVSIVAFNIFAFIESKDDRFVRVKPDMPDKVLISLFNLDYPGLEEVRNLSQQEDYAAAKAKLLEYFGKRRQESWPITEREIAEIDTPYVLRRAGRALKHIYKCKGITLQLPSDINWTKSPINDKEWVYSLNIHEWWKYHALAYLVTENESYSIEFNSQLKDWMIKNPVLKWKNESMPTWRLLEAGCRMMKSWIVSFQLFYHSPYFSDRNKTMMLAEIYNHAQFLKLFKSPRRNHLLYESLGLAYVSVFFPEFNYAPVWKQVATERFKHLIDTEINSDGSYCELSTNYQGIAASYFDKITELSQRDKEGDILDAEHRNKIESLFTFMTKIVRPDGIIPGINDGHLVEAKPILEKASEKYNNPVYEFVASDYKKGKEPEQRSYELPDAGFYVMRSDWDVNARYLLFDGGPFGSAHGHEDKLSFELYAYGKPFLIDPGTYTYDRTNEFRHFFQRSFAHNTIIVDGKSQARFWNRKNWVYHAGYKNTNKWESSDKFDYVVAQYDEGYGNYKERIDRSVTHTRKILFVKPAYWVVFDILQGSGKHKFTQYFHFNPMTVTSVDKNKTVVTKNDNEANLAIFPLQGDGLRLTILEGSEKPIQGWISERFDHKEPAPVAIYTKETKTPATFNTILYPSPSSISADEFSLRNVVVRSNGEEVDKSRAVCLEFKSDDWTDIIMLSHDTEGVKEFAGFRSDAEVVYIRKNPEGRIINQFMIHGKTLKTP